jgi:uncharacterized protein involved in exopolysaccharide biosynthesis
MNAPPNPREQLERVLAIVRRARTYWKRGLAVFVVGALIVVPMVLRRPRSYRSDTVILYQETIQASDVTGGDQASEGARRVGARLRELLLSRASLEPIIHDLNLYPDKIVHGEPIEAVDFMRKNIVFRAQQDGDTYEISFTGDSPPVVQEVTRRLGDCIIQEATKRRESKAKTLKEFLAAESVRTEAEFKQKQSDLATFVVLHPEYAGRLEGLPAAAPSTKMAAGATGDPLLAALEARSAAIERRLAPHTAPSTPLPPTAAFQPPPDSPELVAARHNLADRAALFTDKHPDVIAARSRLQAAEDAQLAINAAALAAWQAQHGVDPGPPPNPAEEANLKKELATLQVQIAARRAHPGASPDSVPSAGSAPEGVAPAVELEFRRLQGEVSDARDRQQQVQSRLFRASIAASSVMDDRNIQVSVLDPAYLPVRAISKPRSMLLGGLLALCGTLGIVVAFASAFLDDRIYDRHDVERFDIPILAIIPKPGTAPMQLGPGTSSLDDSQRPG